MEKKFLFRAYLYVRQNFWYLFPGLMFRFLVQEHKEWKKAMAVLTSEEKEELKQGKRRHVFAFTASLIFHFVFGLIFFYYSLGSVVLIEDQIVQGDIVDFDIMDGMLSSEVDPVYDKTSPFVIKPSSLIRKRKDQSLTDLLEKLRDMKTTSLSGRTSKKRKKYKSQIGQEDYKLKAEWGWKGAKKKIPSQRANLWSRVKSLQSDSTANQNVNYSEIMKVIDRHNFQFQECYEQALLRDESLSGKVIFLLKLNRSQVKKAGLELKGKGNPASRRALTRCLFRESKKLVFSNNKGNISIKFNLIFGL